MRFNFILTLLISLLFSMASTVSANDKQDKYTDYIAALAALEEEDFEEIIIKELETYLQRFPSAPNLDSVHFDIATRYEDRGDETRSFINYMQVIYFYPNTSFSTEAKKKLSVMIQEEGKFKDIRHKTDLILNPVLNNADKKEDKHFAFIRDLYELNFEPITRLLLNSCNDFLRIYPESFDAEAVLFWKAGLLMREEDEEGALAQFMKVTYLYEPSPYVTASKLKMAEIFTDELDMHQRAIYTLEEFILEYPDDPQAAQAQFKIGKIIEEEKETYLEAINAYTAVAEKFPKSVEAVPALFAAARLYEEEFKEYDQAIRLYTEIVRDFPDDLKAPYAFVEAARIYEKRLDDYANAANVYFKVYGNYPDSAIAPESLFASAEIYEDELEDYEKAVSYYRFVVEQYPQHELAKKAKDKIKDLRKKLEEKQEK